MFPPLSSPQDASELTRHGGVCWCSFASPRSLTDPRLFIARSEAPTGASLSQPTSNTNRWGYIKIKQTRAALFCEGLDVSHNWQGVRKQPRRFQYLPKVFHGWPTWLTNAEPWPLPIKKFPMDYTKNSETHTRLQRPRHHKYIFKKLQFGVILLSLKKVRKEKCAHELPFAHCYILRRCPAADLVIKAQHLDKLTLPLWWESLRICALYILKWNTIEQRMLSRFLFIYFSHTWALHALKCTRTWLCTAFLDSLTCGGWEVNLWYLKHTWGDGTAYIWRR